jgi:hypothetical protein
MDSHVKDISHIRASPLPVDERAQLTDGNPETMQGTLED